MPTTQEQFTLEATLRPWMLASGICPAVIFQIACADVGLNHTHMDDHEWCEDEAVRVIAQELLAVTDDDGDPLDHVNDTNLGKVATICITRWATEVAHIVSEDQIADELSILDKPDLSPADLT